jgi:hypothetical protein
MENAPEYARCRILGATGRARGRELVDIDEAVVGKEVKSNVSKIWPRTGGGG